MNDLIDKMESDFEETFSTKLANLDQGGLATVSELATRIREKTERVASLEEDLKQEKRQLLELSDHELPAVMAALDMSEIKLTDGSTYCCHFPHNSR